MPRDCERGEMGHETHAPLFGRTQGGAGLLFRSIKQDFDRGSVVYFDFAIAGAIGNSTGQQLRGGAVGLLPMVDSGRFFGVAFEQNQIARLVERYPRAVGGESGAFESDVAHSLELDVFEPDV